MVSVQTTFESAPVTSVDTCVHLILAAEIEVTALMCVVERFYGKAAALTAAEYWLTELESLDLFPRSREPDWRGCTVSALSRLYRDGHLAFNPAAIEQNASAAMAKKNGGDSRHEQPLDNLESSSGQVKAAFPAAREKHATLAPAISRRTCLVGGTAIGVSLLFGRLAIAKGVEVVPMPSLKEYDIAVNGISLHVTEQGEGPAVLFCHGFPDTSYTWRRQMKAIASAGYRAIAPDMRGYGRSSAPPEASLYTPLQTAGDLVGLLDALKIPSAVLVGHDWGATHAWNAALMRPDRFKAVFCLSVPYVPRGDVSVFEKIRKSGQQNDFYMFEQIRPEADQIWADAAVTIPGILYWASGSAPADTRWNPMDPARSLYRPAPGPLPSWAEPDYVEHNVAEFQRTGFHGGLNYYRAAEPYFYLSAAFKGAKITQPSLYIVGKADGLKELYSLSIDRLRVGLPGLVGSLELDNVGHWVHHEASAEVSDQLVKFLRTVSPA